MNARAVALATLAEWRRGQRFADAIINDSLGASRLSTADRAFVNELFNGVLRNLTLLDFWIGLLRSGSLDATTRDLLRLGLYQIAMLNTPPHAAVYETVALAPQRTRGLVNAVLRAATRRAGELQSAAEEQPLHVRASHPQLLIERWQRQFGESATNDLCAWNNQPPPIYARVNLLKTSVDEFLRAHPGSSLLPNESRFAHVPDARAALESGDCYAQDPSTLVACDLLGAQPNETILDACAAPGGKTSYMAEQMANTGTVVACDRAANRLGVLSANLGRLGVNNTRVVQHDWRNDSLGKLVGAHFDRILVDAPCSNTGVMRRRVDLRWRLRPEDFARMPNEQFEIVRHVIPLLRSGGIFVYSTCSIEPEENEALVRRITYTFPNLALEETRSVLPFRDGFDGAFAARFVCN